MIDLTPLDVRKKSEDFKRAVRGYEPAQVEAFLTLVADRMEQLVGDNRQLAHEAESLRTQLVSYQERERALNEALLAAQELREEARSQAERDAAVRLREAETHAEAILLDADQAIRHSQRRLEDLKARRTQLLRSLRGQLERFDDYMSLEESRLEGEPDELGSTYDRVIRAPVVNASPFSAETVDTSPAEDEDEAEQDEAPAPASTEETARATPAGQQNGSADESGDAARLADAIEAGRSRLDADEPQPSETD